MKLLFSGDHHFDESRRFEECIAVHDWMVELAREQQVSAFVSGGDIYERASTPQERAAVASWLVRMAEVCPVLIAKGNHDRDLDCMIMSRLRSNHPITVEESCGVHRVGNAAIALVAWPDRARVLSYARAHALAAEQVAEEALRAVFAGLGQELSAHEGPRIAALHAMVDGSETSVGQPLLGMPMNVTLSDLALFGADLVVMAHIHKPQAWRYGATQMLYTGSPYRTAFGEVEDKSVVLVEFDDHDVQQVASWKRILTPCAGMHLVNESWDGGFSADLEMHLSVEQVRGAEIRVRYDVLPDAREAAAKAANEWRDRLLAAGALMVKVEERVVSKTRARAPEVSQALSLPDKLMLLWKSKNALPEPERQVRLCEMATTLERDAS